MDVLATVVEVIRSELELEPETSLERSTGLFGELPELDSMAVVNLVLALEQRFEIEIDGDDIGAETFETVGTLVGYIEGRLGAR